MPPAKVKIFPKMGKFPLTIFQLLLLVVLYSEAAFACQVCIPIPTKTLADYILMADTLILARKDGSPPSHFHVEQVLVGEKVLLPDQIPISPSLRQSLQLNPASNLLLARESDKEKWTALGIVDSESLKLIKEIQAKKGEWSPMETKNEQRLVFSIPYLGHSDPLLHKFAYLELARAPYSLIKKINNLIPLQMVRKFLLDSRYTEWRPLAILLMGLSDDREDQLQVIGKFKQKQQFGHTINLSAWITAYLEIKGVNGLNELNALYLSKTSRSQKEMDQVFKAISVHAANDLDLRKLVVPMYRDTFNNRPSLAPLIVRDLIAWKNWYFVEQFSAIYEQLKQPDPLGAMQINLYLRNAKVSKLL